MKPSAPSGIYSVTPSALVNLVLTRWPFILVHLTVSPGWTLTTNGLNEVKEASTSCVSAIAAAENSVEAPRIAVNKVLPNFILCSSQFFLKGFAFNCRFSVA